MSLTLIAVWVVIWFAVGEMIAYFNFDGERREDESDTIGH